MGLRLVVGGLLVDPSSWLHYSWTAWHWTALAGTSALYAALYSALASAARPTYDSETGELLDGGANLQSSAGGLTE